MSNSVYQYPLRLDTSLLKKVLMDALSSGGDFADLFIEYRTSLSISMEEDLIKETDENLSMGLGIRVIKKERTGYAYTNDLDEEKLIEAARLAAAIAGTGKPPQKNIRFKPVKAKSQAVRVKNLATASSLAEKIDLVRRAYQSALNYERAIKKVQVTYRESTQHVWILNSEGLSIKDCRPMVKLAVRSLAEKSGRREAGYYGGGGRVGLEFFNQSLAPEAIGEESAREACLLLEAVEPPAGQWPVILSPGHSGVLVHEAVGHLLEADFIRKKTSIFWDKLGQQVASGQITIYDDPTIPGFRGSYNIDDEGTPAEKTLLVEKGSIRDFLYDKLSARLMEKKANGHGRREDFTNWPLPRMSNTYIARGEYSPGEIIKSVKKGFYVNHLSGGQVEDSGQFTFSISLGFLIENGRLTRPVKQATLIGNNLDILQKVEMVGSDLEFGLQTATCGKESQEVPVNDGCPTMKITRMTIGGQP
ncbi:MAG: TldD/PmbA family protein [Acidobacteriota bacterium]|nr:TldD/PmbA family protein [Acidobacteriota bacterium]